MPPVTPGPDPDEGGIAWHRTVVEFGLGLGVMAVVLLTPRVDAQGPSQGELRKPFIGTWRLVSIEGGTPGGQATRGARPTGLIVYDETEPRETTGCPCDTGSSRPIHDCDPGWR